MARVKLTEFKTKKILYESLNKEYRGYFVDIHQDIEGQLKQLDSGKKYVVKVDQGTKKRFKNGLIGLDFDIKQIAKFIKDISEKGYSGYIVEEYLKYSSDQEKYLSIERTREGLLIRYTEHGGVDVEDSSNEVYSVVINSFDTKVLDLIQNDDKLRSFENWLPNIIDAFENNYFSFLEINPLLIVDNNPVLLDAACEVDDAGEFFVNGRWSKNDFARPIGNVTEEIENVRVLASGSQASLKLDLLNPDGSLFLLLSGGGASIVLADELYNMGYGKEIANYGEYSGNPNDEETYTYTKNVLSLLFKSKAKHKAIVIAGGVANFTDIRKTFKGIVRALDEYSVKLRDQDVKVFVRRGGPYQKEGLSLMREFLESHGLYGGVWGPDVVLTNVVKTAGKSVQ
jgi:succinyl-CoA synthetase beta subunit